MSADRKTSTHSKGRKGEEAAVAYLVGLGYEVIDRNVHMRYGELDCVAKDGDELVFVEVKTRASTRFGTPQEAVSATKQMRLCRAAARYLQERDLLDAACRFDVVFIVSSSMSGRAGPEIVHLTNAFTCDDPLF